MANVNIPLNFLNRRKEIATPMESYVQGKNMAGNIALSNLMSNPALSDNERMKAALPVLGSYDPMSALNLQTSQSDNARAQSNADRTYAMNQEKVDLTRAKMLLSSGTEADISELQQLWKDNKRFMTQHGAKYGTGTESYKQAELLQSNLESKLKTLAPDIWGGAVDTTTQAPTEQTDAEKSIRANEYKMFKNNQIANKVIDKDKDGVSDTKIGIVKDAVREFVKKNNYGEKEQKELINFVDELNSDIKTANSTKLENLAKKQNISNASQNQKLREGDAVAEIGMIMGGLDAIEKNPTSYGEVEDLLTSLLRKESGAAIAADEVVTRMKGSLDPQSRREIEDELNGLYTIIGGTLNSRWADARAKKVLFKYIPKMNQATFKRKLVDGLNPEAVKLWKTGKTTSSQNVTTNTPDPLGLGL